MNYIKKTIKKCPVCGFDRFSKKEKETKLIRAPRGSFVFQCQNCKFMFLNPIIVSEYEEEYFKTYDEKGIEHPGGSSSLPNHLKSRLLKLESYIKPGNLLEVGFGEGLFLDYANRRGWKVYGVDISKYAVENVRRKFNLQNLYNKTLVDVNFPASFFDIIHMNHVLEHIPDLVTTIKELKRILKKNGLLVVEVPNEFYSLQEKLRELIGIKRKPYEVPSSHVWFFTTKTLKNLFKKYGFKIKKIRTIRRNKEKTSKYIGGALIKRFIYFLEDIFHLGPIIEIWLTV